MPRYDCSLWTLLKSAATGKRIAFSARMQILKIMLEVFIYIQSEGYCHLDLKPSNILINLNKNGEWNGQDIVVTDFGLCVLQSDGLKGSGQSGTPGFSSLEQFIGRPHRKSDNYAMGKTAILILFEWQLGWNLLAQPLTDQQYCKHPLKHTVVSEVISNLLEVSTTQENYLFNQFYFHSDKSRSPRKPAKCIKKIILFFVPNQFEY